MPFCEPAHLAFHIPLIILVSCWIAAGVQAYSVGRMVDRETAGKIGV